MRVVGVARAAAQRAARRWRRHRTSKPASRQRRAPAAPGRARRARPPAARPRCRQRLHAAVAGGRLAAGTAVQHQMEHAAHARRAAHADAAALRLHQPARQRQAQAGALVLLAHSRRRAAGTRRTGAAGRPPRCRCRCPRPRCGSAAAPSASARTADPAALGRELDGVRQVVVEHLLQPRRVEHQVGQRRVDLSMSSCDALALQPPCAGCRRPP